MALLAGALPCFAQISGSIDGSVYDTSGGAIPGTSLTLTNTGTGETRTATSSTEGFFRFVDLSRGRYELKVSAAGFVELTMSALELTVGQQMRVRPVLQVGSVSQSVEVTGTPPPLSISSASLADLVDSRRIEQLPLNGRNALQLIALVPGAIDAGTEGQFGAQQSVFSVAGGRTTDMNFTLDGGFNMNTYFSIANEYPNPDALQEFAVSVRTYSATFGRGSSLVSAVTKSGTNKLHGSAFEFLRNTELDARPFFAATRPGFKRNQYGATLGGPVVRNKAFFFVSYQGTKVRGSPSDRRYQTLNQAERQGDFSLLKRVNDPTNGQAFPGNLIPASRIRPYASKFMDQYLPAANSGPNYYDFAIASTLDQNQLIAKFDYSFSDNDKVSARYFLNDVPQKGVGSAQIPSNAWLDKLPTRFQSTNLSYTHLFSPRFLNDLRFTEVRNAFGVIAPFPFSLDGLGLGVNTQNSTTKYGLTPQGVMVASGFFSAQPPNPCHDSDPTTHWNDTASWTSGKHTVQFGGELYRNVVDHTANWLTGGQLNFNGSATGNAAADFLVGKFYTFRQIMTSPQKMRQWLPSLFVQDDYRVLRNVTLNLGLRWEPFLGWISEYDTLSAFLPGVQSTRYPKMAPGLVYPGDAGLPESIVGSRFKNVAPRVGLAWDVRGNGRTSVRAGFGLYFVPMTRSIGLGRFTLIQPFALDVTVNGGDTDNLFAAAPFNGVNPFPRPSIDNPNALRNVDFIPTLNQYSLVLPFKTPTDRQWSLSIQQAMGANSVFEMSYVGASSSHLFTSAERNPAIYIPGQSTVANTQSRRLYPQFGSVNGFSDSLSTNHNSLQVSFKRRYAAGVSISTFYTWSKALGVVGPVAEGGTGPRDPWDYHLDYGPLAGDIKHNFVTSLVWDVPFAKMTASRVGRALAGGWQVSAIHTLRSGPPFTILSGGDHSLVSIGRDTANQIGDWRLPAGRSRSAKIAAYFNPAAFAQNPIGTFGTTGMDSMRAPGLWNLDLTAAKALYRAERRRLEFRGSFYNLLNFANFSPPNGTQSSTTFAQISNTGPPRVIEFALKFAF